MNLRSAIREGVAVLFVLGVLVGGLLFWRSCQRTKKEEPSQQVQNPLLLKEVDSLRDANGKLYAQLEQKVYTQAEVNHLLDSVAKALGIRVKTIKGVERVVVKLDTVYRKLPADTIYTAGGVISGYKVEKHDGWNDIIATVLGEENSISYSARDTLTRIEVVKNPLFGPAKRYIYQTNSNPAMRIQQGASFTIKEKQPYLSIGPYLGYDPFTNRVDVGIGVTVPLINLKR